MKVPSVGDSHASIQTDDGVGDRWCGDAFGVMAPPGMHSLLVELKFAASESVHAAFETQG
jgi:hypothetical protein